MRPSRGLIAAQSLALVLLGVACAQAARLQRSEGSDLSESSGGLSESLSEQLKTMIGGSGVKIDKRLSGLIQGDIETKASAKVEVDKEKEIDFFKEPGELIKLFLNPIELVKAISVKYKLHFAKFVEAIGKPLVFGIEAALTPFTITIKVIEKVFEPDNCRLHFVCKLGSNISFLKENVPKFSTGFGSGSRLIKAFGEGMLGGDCFEKFTCTDGEPKLKKEYESLRKE